MITQARLAAIKEIQEYTEIPKHLRDLLQNVAVRHIIALENSLGTIRLAFMRGEHSGRGHM